MEGVVKVAPVPIKVPPVDASYQSMVVPAVLVAERLTVPGPHLEPFTGDVGTAGRGLTVMITVDVAAVHGPAPSGSFVANVRVTFPLATDGV